MSGYMRRYRRTKAPYAPLLTPSEARERACRIRLLLTDCDGTLTDSGVYYSEAGEAMKRYSIRDGKGVELLRGAGIETGILTGERSPSIEKRAEKLGIRTLHLGVKRKNEELGTILRETGSTLQEIAFIGDDVNDLEIIHTLRETGLTGAPADATTAVLEAVQFRCTRAGGNGAFREFADWILQLRMQRRDGQPHQQ